MAGSYKGKINQTDSYLTYEALKGYRHLNLKLASSDNSAEDLKQNPDFLFFQDILSGLGIDMQVSSDNCLSLNMNPDVFNVKAKRNAGAKRKLVYQENNDSPYSFNQYRFSDIVYMLQESSDTDIMEALNIKRATYYRHKNRLMNSTYYNKLDKARLSDMSYLKSVPGDFSF